MEEGRKYVIGEAPFGLNLMGAMWQRSMLVASMAS